MFIFSGSLTILLPPILTSSNANTWLSTRCQKRLNSSIASTADVKSRKNDNEDLSKWLSGGRKQKNEDPLAEGTMLIF